MSYLIQIRRDTEANWASINPILAQGEFGYVLDSQEFKIKKGDGVTAWNSLPFIEFGDKALWGNIGGDITNQPDLMNYLQNLQDDIDDEASARASSDQTLTNQYNSLNTAVSGIQAVIPNDATAQNQLADKSFVNSSIASSTANFIGTFNSVAEMEAYSGTLTNNDYAFVRTTDSAGNTLYDRYKWNGTEWLFEYELNNSSFTAEQWASINSKATENKIAQITTNATNITTLQGQVAGKQDTITDLATIRSNAQAGKSASDTIATYGNIVTHNVSEFATSAQGATADSAIQGVQVNGTDLTKDINKKVNIPVGTSSVLGVYKVNPNQGISAYSAGDLVIISANESEIIAKTHNYKPIVPSKLDIAVREGLGNNSLTWTEAYKTSARNTIGAEAQATIQTLSATDSITLADNTIYNGGEQTSLTIAVPATVDVSFLCEIDFTSGATPATLAYPNTIKWLGDDVANNVFVPVASKRYTIICAYDGVNYRATVKGV